ncbi:MAG TPA: hypothetical protein VJ083_06745 [Sedimentibacter sp.]|nr:hypothetical protein [Sedimentibacter sp.]
MKRYENLGTPIEIQIQDEYYVVAFINLVNKEKSEYKCDLHIRDKEAGIMMELESDQEFTLLSAFKTVKVDVTAKLSELINNGCFTEQIEYIKKVYECMEAALKLQKEN